MLRPLFSLLDRWLGEPLRKVEAASLAYRQSDAGRRFDTKTVTVLLTIAGCLVLQTYTSHPARLIPVAPAVARLVAGPEAGAAVERQLLAWDTNYFTSRLWWAAAAVLIYTVPPILVIRFVFGERLRDYGTKLRGAFVVWPLYAVSLAVMLPLVWFCSAEKRFQWTYPLCGAPPADDFWGNLLRWELLYGLQFVALEFFFRGFMVHGTKHRFGAYSPFVMTVPYVMIHFAKPLPEALGSIIAGVVLGLLSLATRSIWLGVGLHLAVAWGMDAACLTRGGYLG